MREATRRFWEGEATLSLFLLCLIVVVFVLSPIVKVGLIAPIEMDFVWAVMLVTGLSTIERSPALRLIGIFLAAGTIAASVAARESGHSAHLAAVGMAARSGCFLLFLYIVLKQTMRPGKVTAHRVQGGIAAYLIIGLLWATFYAIGDIVTPASFQGIPGPTTFEPFIYVSFTTLTSLGPSNISPQTDIVRTLMMAEAAIGQLYPAIFIARLVSLQIEDTKKS